MDLENILKYILQDLIFNKIKSKYNKEDNKSKLQSQILNSDIDEVFNTINAIASDSVISASKNIWIETILHQTMHDQFLIKIQFYKL